MFRFTIRDCQRLTVVVMLLVLMLVGWRYMSRCLEIEAERYEKMLLLRQQTEPAIQKASPDEN
jgi:hypothetical protein